MTSREWREIWQAIDALRRDLMRVAREARYPIGGAGGTCDAQNEIQVVQTIGQPTGGTFGLTLQLPDEDGVIVPHTITSISHNASGAALIAAFEAHPVIVALRGDGNTDPQFQTVGGLSSQSACSVEFIGEFEHQNIPLMLVVNTIGLTGGTGMGVVVTTDQQGRAS